MRPAARSAASHTARTVCLQFCEHREEFAGVLDTGARHRRQPCQRRWVVDSGERVAGDAHSLIVTGIRRHVLSVPVAADNATAAHLRSSAQPYKG